LLGIIAQIYFEHFASPILTSPRNSTYRDIS
jgi:hypothetical protein